MRVLNLVLDRSSVSAALGVPVGTLSPKDKGQAQRITEAPKGKNNHRREEPISWIA